MKYEKKLNPKKRGRHVKDCKCILCNINRKKNKPENVKPTETKTFSNSETSFTDTQTKLEAHDTNLPMVEIPTKNEILETNNEPPTNPINTSNNSPVQSNINFDSIINEYQNKEVETKTQPEPDKEWSKVETKEVEHKLIVSGYILLMAIDFVTPLVAIFILRRINVEYKQIKKADIQLTNAQIAELAPICDQLAKELALYLKPVHYLILALTINYSMNISEALEKLIPQIKNKK